ncbi:hypothetical protein SY83_09285 [Paenibacillus swuensis]|uniref:Alpha-galactosidase n=1 Tax=Paenibacillus swuensis TaxID=1178515 RepID=A0A172THS0_9BACL|nr:alpha-galactosidase [Paenibacillus swuensis]ANE46434.1 hypothetical protein SY83_09285 [Paenibacillus swuensis]
MTPIQFGNDHVTIILSDHHEGLWAYRVAAEDITIPVYAPRIQLNGTDIQCDVKQFQLNNNEPLLLPNGSVEYQVTGPVTVQPSLFLTITFRIAPTSPVIRFKYTFSSTGLLHMTKTNGSDELDYFSYNLKHFQPTEIRLSDYNELVHSYTLSEHRVQPSWFKYERMLMGPLLAAEDGSHTVLSGYEHGSQYPDMYTGFQLHSDYTVTVSAKKGNYPNLHALHPEESYTSIWFQFAVVRGSLKEMEHCYRTFILEDISLCNASRKPYIYYNTWAYQERNRHWNRSKYLDSMHLERVLNEIDTAAGLGVEVYVIDTGWYEKTGDWNVDLTRFPDGLQTVKARLDQYGMQLGLWFDPKVAAVSSQILKDHKHCAVSKNGIEPPPFAVWETELSQRMCLVSEYGDAFADHLIRLHQELGVTYFKWDAVGQYECDAAGHGHGSLTDSYEEREQSFAFRLATRLGELAERIALACPGAIIDLDVTESYRSFGLSFLTAGKYFLVNNGPYFPNYNVPADEKDPYYNYNLFFYPGPARGWICRTPLTYDKWIPSVLLLTHYLPDDPVTNQTVNIASLILGQNGLWGDLLGISQEGVSYIASLLGMYKQIREDMTAAPLLQTGQPGTNPEVYEKVNPVSGRGAVVLFANSFGQPFHKARNVQHTYITRNIVHEAVWCTPGVLVSIQEDGYAVIQAEFNEPGAAIIFFGVH